MSVKEQVDNLLWGFLYNWVYDDTAKQILNERLAQLIKTTRQEERNHMQYEEQHYKDGKLEVKLTLGAPQPIEVWMVYPSGAKIGLTMDAPAARVLIERLQKLASLVEAEQHGN